MWVNLTTDQVESLRLGASGPTFKQTVEEIVDADDAAQRSAAENASVILKAQALYADDDTEIDDLPAVSVNDCGAWVAAWVWVPSGDEELADEDGE